MIKGLANVTLAVRDYDEAIQWFTEKLGLELRMDGSMGGDYRFVTVGVPGQDDVSIVLHKTPESDQGGKSSIHGFLFHTDDCRNEAQRLRENRCENNVGTGGAALGCSGCFRGPVWQHTCLGRTGVLINSINGRERRGS